MRRHRSWSRNSPSVKKTGRSRQTPSTEIGREVDPRPAAHLSAGAKASSPTTTASGASDGQPGISHGTKRGSLMKHKRQGAVSSTFAAPSVFPVYIPKGCNGGDGKKVHGVQVGGNHKSLLHYLVRISITLNPSCEPRKRRVNYNMTVMISCVTGGSIDVLRANIKDRGVILPPMWLCRHNRQPCTGH